MATEKHAPPGCLTCAGQGVAKSVAIRWNQRTVTYECATCEARWEATDTVPDPHWLADQPAPEARAAVPQKHDVPGQASEQLKETYRLIRTMRINLADLRRGLERTHVLVAELRELRAAARNS